MEQALIDKMKDGTADNVDKAMIVARVGHAVELVGDLVTKFTEDYNKLYQEYTDEIRMSGISLLMGLSAHPSMLEKSGNEEDDKIGLKTMIITGSSDNLKKTTFPHCGKDKIVVIKTQFAGAVGRLPFFLTLNKKSCYY